MTQKVKVSFYPVFNDDGLIYSNATPIVLDSSVKYELKIDFYGTNGICAFTKTLHGWSSDVDAKDIVKKFLLTCHQDFMAKLSFGHNYDRSVKPVVEFADDHNTQIFKEVLQEIFEETNPIYKEPLLLL